MEKQILLAAFQRMHNLELACIFHRRKPGFQKIGTARNQQIGVFHVVGNQALKAEHLFVGTFKGFIGIRFKHQRTG